MKNISHIGGVYIYGGKLLCVDIINFAVAQYYQIRNIKYFSVPRIQYK